jgi:hypothetical protein
MKPYAWINVNDEYKIMFDDELPTHYPEAWIPLYTHPAKELTNEEIIGCWEGVDPPEECWIADEHRILFAKAILRKAKNEQ